MSRRQFSLVRHLCVLATAKNNREARLALGATAAKTLRPRIAGSNGERRPLVLQKKSRKASTLRLAPYVFQLLLLCQNHGRLFRRADLFKEASHCCILLNWNSHRVLDQRALESQ